MPDCDPIPPVAGGRVRKLPLIVGFGVATTGRPDGSTGATGFDVVRTGCGVGLTGFCDGRTGCGVVPTVGTGGVGTKVIGVTKVVSALRSSSSSFSLEMCVVALRSCARTGGDVAKSWMTRRKKKEFILVPYLLL